MSAFSSPRPTLSSANESPESKRRGGLSSYGDSAKTSTEKESRNVVAALKRTLTRRSVADIEELRAEIYLATRRAEELVEQNFMLGEQLDTAKVNLDTVTRENDTLQGELSHARSKFEEAAKQGRDLRSDLETARLWQGKLSERNEHLRGELERITGHSAQVGKENVDLKQELVLLKGSLLEQKEKTEVLQGELGKARCRLGTMSSNGVKQAVWSQPEPSSVDHTSQMSWYGRFCGIRQ
ncbi:hypothetical protein BSKO_07344 [Bryopsis sp. KO-2023]|nr:hypothetical protein BSKO_07344 [Bryopsis sp. KO-2023]